ncbi:MAG TPA: phage major capsid protein [Steroidobacter sp.]|uniref:phage major capsid protein n=1 Tax=Steroidobacter sp. TaxID=1978227 RepID=UPI002ED80B16
MSGFDFVRIARSIAVARKRGIAPEAAADQLYPGRSSMIRRALSGRDTLVKDAVGPIDTTSVLTPTDTVTGAYAASVRPATVLGQLPTTPVPFSTQLPFISTGTEADFTGESMPIACRAPQFGTNLFLPRLKINGLIVMSNEMLESSEGEAVLERDLRAAEIAATDRRLLDPTSNAIARTRPASITYGAPAFDATGASEADDIRAVVGDLLGSLLAAGSNLQAVHFITSTANCAALALMTDSLGNRSFPTVTATGGTLAGLPLLASGSAPANTLVAVDGAEILVADRSEVEISTSKFALIDQDDGPEGTNRVSMFQTESTAIRLTRWLNWHLRNPFCAYATNFAPPMPHWSAS